MVSTNSPIGLRLEFEYKNKKVGGGDQPEVLFLVAVQLGEESLLAVSEAARGEYFDKRRDNIISSHSVGLAGVHLLLEGVAQVGLQAPGGHKEVDLQPLEPKYVLVVSVDLVTHLGLEGLLWIRQVLCRLHLHNI